MLTVRYHTPSLSDSACARGLRFKAPTLLTGLVAFTIMSSPSVDSSPRIQLAGSSIDVGDYFAGNPTPSPISHSKNSSATSSDLNTLVDTSSYQPPKLCELISEDCDRSPTSTLAGAPGALDSTPTSLNKFSPPLPRFGHRSASSDPVIPNLAGISAHTTLPHPQTPQSYRPQPRSAIETKFSAGTGSGAGATPASGSISSTLSGSPPTRQSFCRQFKHLLAGYGTSPVRRTRMFQGCLMTLPDECRVIPGKKCAALIESNLAAKRRGRAHPRSADAGLLIVDVRPFQEYCKNHICGAVNICLPSTLLRRRTFTLEKCIQTLASSEKAQLSGYLAGETTENLPDVLFYDSKPCNGNSVSSSVCHLVRKFVNCPRWRSRLLVLEDGLPYIAKHYPQLVCAGASPFTDAGSPTDVSPVSSSASSISSASSTSPLADSFVGQRTDACADDSASEASCSRYSSRSSLGLSHFTLPGSSHSYVGGVNTAGTTGVSGGETTATAATSGIDVGNAACSGADISGIGISTVAISASTPPLRVDKSLHLNTKFSAAQRSHLPRWLIEIFSTDGGATQLARKFLSLQAEERRRLNAALAHTGGVKSNTGVIAAGVTLPKKNRYQDIFPYEHARVKLQRHAEEAELDEESSYINASFLRYPPCGLHYIAAQGPLAQTIGDFWRIVCDQEVPLILSLTPEREHEVEKCAPYWRAGTYWSNGVRVHVKLLESEPLFELAHGRAGDTVIRRFEVRVGARPVHQVLQVHLLSWKDYGTTVDAQELLSLVALKRYILHTLKTHHAPVLVHCSAGCGRTGCFCAIDTCIDLLLKGKKDESQVHTPTKCKEHPITSKLDKSSQRDLVYDIISTFRSQRVAMVQNLRQYILIYDAVLTFKKNQLAEGSDYREGLYDWSRQNRYGIIDRFLTEYRQNDN